MAWDASRPVPWRQLFREWLIYAAIMAVVFGLILRSSTALGSAIGLLFSLPIYLALGVVMAKLGYRRPTFRRRTTNAGTSSASGSGTVSTGSSTRGRPAPTRRTSTGPSQHRRRTTKSRRR
jgi:hypothetical protein